MARLRNPRYAPEFLEKRLSPSGAIARAQVPTEVAPYSTTGPLDPPPPPKPGDPDLPDPPLPGGP